MRKIFFILATLLSLSVFAQTDYVYPTEIEYDEEEGLYYFDVYLKGEKIYTGYGMDIQLPSGMTVFEDEEGPYVIMLEEDNMYPKNRQGYSHTVTPYLHGASHLRVACISTSNANFRKTEGGLFRVYVNLDYTGGWPIGGIKIYEALLGQVGNTVYPKDKTFPILLHSGETTLPLSVSASAHWSTCTLPFDAAIPEGVEAYTCEGVDGDVMNLAEETEFKAYTPYILYSETGFSGTVTGTVETTHPAEGYVNSDPLCGAIVPQTAKDGFVMQNLGGEVMFYPIKEGSTFTVPAGKCWVPASQNLAKVRSLDFNIIGTTGIVEKKTMKADNTIYSLDGRIVTEMIPGKIYIQNGEKVLKTK